MRDPAAARLLLHEALADSVAAPLSVRRAMLVVSLVDALADHRARADGADPLQARIDLATGSPELGLVLELAAHRADGPRLVVESVDVPLASLGSLSTAEFMVSLYNERTVPRLLVALPEGGRLDAQHVLREAVEGLDRTP